MRRLFLICILMLLCIVKAYGQFNQPKCFLHYVCDDGTQICIEQSTCGQEFVVGDLPLDRAYRISTEDDFYSTVIALCDSGKIDCYEWRSIMQNTKDMLLNPPKDFIGCMGIGLHVIECYVKAEATT